MAFSYEPKAGLAKVQIIQTYEPARRTRIITVFTDDAVGLVNRWNAAGGGYTHRLIETCSKCGKHDREVIDGLCADCYYQGVL